MNTVDTPALRLRLDDARRLDAEYGASLTNHLPMALVALARLGADDERCAEFARRYAQRLHAAPPDEPWPAGDAWRAHLGQPRAWPRYRALFRDWMFHEGPTDVLEQVLPHSGNSIRIGISGVPGVGKSTFIEAFGMMLVGAGLLTAGLTVRW